MGSVINKKEILDSLKSSRWLLDELSIPILQKLKEETVFSNESSYIQKNTLKNFAISYYVSSSHPLHELFYYSLLNEEFNLIILEKINKGGEVDFFSDTEKKHILDSLDCIKKICIGNSQFIDDLSFIKIKTEDFKSATSPHLIGAIALTNQINYANQYELTKSIIHELAHLELFLINFFDRLVKESADRTVAYSPYQKTERPPIGRLHSLWALYRMIQYGRYENLNTENERSIFFQTSETLLDNVMTEFGIYLIKMIRNEIENIR